MKITQSTCMELRVPQVIECFSFYLSNCLNKRKKNDKYNPK